MTSTLQQEASRKLRLSSQQTMRVAQRLYENGFITYMRTDSTTLSESALTAARAQAVELYGADAIPAEPRRYERRVKNAQEAHEAIRPAGDRFQTPDEVRRQLSGEEFNLYELIWKRTVASQMADARGQTVSVRIGSTASDGQAGRVRDRRHGHHLPRLPARLRGGPRRAGDRCRGEAAAAPPGGPVADGDDARARRPLDLAAGALHRGDAREGARGARHRPAVDVRGDHGHDPRSRLRAQAGPGARAGVPRVRGRQPARAVLLEARRLRVHRADGGRPRPDRRRRRGAHRLAAAVLLRRAGQRQATRASSTWSRTSARSTRARSTRSRSATASTCGSGNTGRISSAKAQRQTLPPGIAPDELTPERAEELLSQGQQQRELGDHPETGRAITVRDGRYGPYVTEDAPEGEKARTASLFKSMAPDTVTLDAGGAAADAAADARRVRRARRWSPRTAATAPT